MKEPAYIYAVNIVRVIDGDTLVVDVDMGFRCWQRKISIRLTGINCPEKNTLDGKRVKNHVEQIAIKMPEGWVLVSQGEDKFGGRWNGVLYPPWKEETSLNQYLLDNNMAVPFMVPK